VPGQNKFIYHSFSMCNRS